MAEYRFSAKIVSRGSGQSVIAKAAYNAREAIRDERTGQMKDYSRGKGLEFSGIFAPKNAPEWMKDRAQLWNAVELQEDGTTRHATAQLARNIELNIPHELMDPAKGYQDGIRLVRDFVREQFVRQGMVADVAIHAPHAHGDQRNYHAHILLTLREIDGDGFSADKARHWNSKELNLQWRSKWAELGARYLAKAGFEQEAERYSYSHLTLKEQFREAARRGDLAHAETRDREPTKHLGPQAAAMERRGLETERGQLHTETVELNKLRAELRGVEKQIEAEQQKAERTAEPKEKEIPAPANLKGAMLDIYAAYQQSDSAPAFAASLEERGIALARVTKNEAEQSRSDAATARAEGRFAPTLSAGEIVAVTDRGYTYRLNERTTGADFAAVQKSLQTLDPSTLKGVEATKRTMQEQRREKWHDHQEELKAHLKRPGVVDFALDEERVKPQSKGRDAREIHAAFGESNRPKPFRSDAFRLRAFLAALDEQGMSLARVTQQEAAKSHREAAFAREAGNRAPSYREGEIVAVTLQGTVHRLDEKTTGLDADQFKHRLSKLDGVKLQSLEATKAAMTERATQHRADLTAERMERARTPALDFRTENTHDAVARGLGATARQTVKSVSKVDKLITRTVGKALDAVASAVGALLSFFFADAPKTKEQVAAIRDENRRSAHAQAIAGEKAERQAASDHQHDAATAKQDAAAAQEQRQREEYRRLRRSDPERERER